MDAKTYSANDSSKFFCSCTQMLSCFLAENLRGLRVMAHQMADEEVSTAYRNCSDIYLHPHLHLTHSTGLAGSCTWEYFAKSSVGGALSGGSNHDSTPHHPRNIWVLESNRPPCFTGWNFLQQQQQALGAQAAWRGMLCCASSCTLVTGQVQGA